MHVTQETEYPCLVQFQVTVDCHYIHNSVWQRLFTAFRL